MLNLRRNSQNFWIATLISALMLVLIAEQRSHRKLLNNIRNTFESIGKKNNLDNRRLLNFLSMPSDKIVNINLAKFYVPNYPTDLIQSEIVDNGTFFEIDLLKELQPYIKKNAVILDIGANIGNHSVYWAVKTDAKRIYSFEPVKDFFKILQKNVEINNLNNKIKIFNIGLSDKKINGSISFYDRTNIGGTHVKQDPNGNLLLDKLDNIKIEENAVDFVKIDVEGHELKVLQGARETLLKYRPTIFIETFPDKKLEVHEYLTNLGYHLEKSFAGSNYLYVSNLPR